MVLTLSSDHDVALSSDERDPPQEPLKIRFISCIPSAHLLLHMLS